jgi:hypothetical protein
MTDRKGFFALEAIPSGWWDETTQTIGWFSDDLLTDATTGGAVPLIEAADCTNSGNNTASTSWDLDRPAYSAGDLIVFCLCSDGGVTHDWPATGPDSETIVSLVDSEGGATTRSSVFYYIAGGAQSAGVLTVTPSATEQWTATVFRVPAGEFNATTPIETSAWDYPGANSATPTLPALTAGPADGRVVGWFGVDTDDIDPPAPSGWSIITTVDRGAVGGTLVSRDAGTTAAESVASSVWSIPVAGRHTSISFIVNAPSGATNYDLTADAGSYAITGTAAGLVAARRLAADAGSYAITGTDAGLAKGVRLTADAGTFTVTGTAATLTVARRLTADSASYAVTGTAAGLNVGRRLTADGGSYALSGAEAGLIVARRVAADAGSYSVAGTDATLTKSRRLDAEAGGYAISGADAGLAWGRKLSADAGSYAITGTAATLSKSRVFIAAPGAFALTGTAAVFAILRPTVDSIRVPVWTSGGAVAVPDAQAAGAVDVPGPGSSGAVAVPIQAASETIRVRRI